MKHTIDALGKTCPQPVVLTMKVLQKAVSGDIVEVLVDNETAVSNLNRLAESRGCSFVSEKTGESEYLVRICAGEDEKAADMPATDKGAVGETVINEEAADMLAADKTAADEIQKREPDKMKESECNGPLMVAVSSDKMGEGDDELGHLLMKGFLYAVTQLETLPAAVLFYNGGAKLTVEASPCLEDLRNLEEQGVEIFTCGTCLDYYKLKDKLAVGNVTNMYSIVEMLAGAGKVVRP